MEDSLVEQIEKAREDAAHKGIGAVDTPADDDVSGVAGIPELLEIARIALAVGVKAEEVLGLAHLHAFAHGLGVAFSRITQVEADGKLGSKRAEDIFGIVPAAVFANDEADIGGPGEFGIHSADCCFDALAFVMDG